MPQNVTPRVEVVTNDAGVSTVYFIDETGNTYQVGFDASTGERLARLVENVDDGPYPLDLNNQYSLDAPGRQHGES